MTPTAIWKRIRYCKKSVRLCAARFGGDELIVYMKSAGGMQVVTEKAAEIIHAVNAIKIGTAAPICCSIGIAGIAGRDTSYESVLRQADAALYEAKENGKN